MKTDLRITDTNAASDSKGRTWGLEGGLFWWLVGGVGRGIILFFVVLVPLKSSMTASLPRPYPNRLSLAYIFGLRQGKPPGYDRESLNTGSAAALARYRGPRNTPCHTNTD